MDQPVCDLQNKPCHWSCKALGCRRYGYHQCTPIPKNGLTARNVYITAHGGHSLASQYGSRAPAITQVCEHGYSETRPKNQKKQAVGQQPQQQRTRKAPAATPAKRHKKNAKPQTRLKPAEVLRVCTAAGKYGGATCAETNVYAWTARALAIPDSAQFTTKVGDLICSTCRVNLMREINRFNADQASTEAVCKAPTEKSNREIWMEFGESDAARDFNKDIEENFPVFEIPAALRLPWERTLSQYDLCGELVPGSKADMHARHAFCHLGYSFLGTIIGRGKVTKSPGGTSSHVVFNGLQARLAKIMKLGNTSAAFKVLSSIGITISDRGVTNQLTLQAKDWQENMKLEGGDVVAWVDNLEILTWKLNFESAIQRVEHVALGGPVPSNEELMTFACRCNHTGQCEKATCKCNKAGHVCVPALCYCPCVAGIGKGTNKNTREAWMLGWEAKKKEMPADEAARNNPVSKGKGDGESKNYRQLFFVVGNIGNVRTPRPFTAKQCRPYHASIASVTFAELTSAGFRANVIPAQRSRFERYWQSTNEVASRLDSNPAWAQQFAERRRAVQVADAQLSEIATACEMRYRDQWQQLQPESSTEKWYNNADTARKVYRMYSQDDLISPLASLQTIVLSLKREQRDQKNEETVRHREKVDLAYLDVLRRCWQSTWGALPTSASYASKAQAKALRTKLLPLLDAAAKAAKLTNHSHSLRELKCSIAALGGDLASDDAAGEQPAKGVITQRMHPTTIGSAQSWEKCNDIARTMMNTAQIKNEPTLTGEGRHWPYNEDVLASSASTSVPVGAIAVAAAAAAPAPAPEEYNSPWYAPEGRSFTNAPDVEDTPDEEDAAQPGGGAVARTVNTVSSVRSFDSQPRWASKEVNLAAKSGVPHGWSAPASATAPASWSVPPGWTEPEPLFFLCSDYGIAQFYDDLQRQHKYGRMVEVLALLHFTFAALEAWVEKYHAPLGVIEVLFATLNVSSDAQTVRAATRGALTQHGFERRAFLRQVFLTKPTADVRKMLTAHKQWIAAVGVGVHRLVHQRAAANGVVAGADGACRRMQPSVG